MPVNDWCEWGRMTLRLPIFVVNEVGWIEDGAKGGDFKIISYVSFFIKCIERVTSLKPMALWKASLVLLLSSQSLAISA